MISVMSEREIDRSTSSPVADLSLFGFEESQEGLTVGDEESADPSLAGSKEGRGSAGFESLEPESGLEARDFENSERDLSGSMDFPSREAEMTTDVARISQSGAEEEGFREIESVDGLSAMEAQPYELYPTSRRFMHGFEIGDMVWGKVKSHPWWPGHIYNEAFASKEVRGSKKECEGHVLVAFYGDSSYGWFDPAELIPFEPHFPEKSKQTTSRNFVRAVEEAVDESSRRGALGLVCLCRNPTNFRPKEVPGYYAVDVVGYEPNGLYSSKQIKTARENFCAVDVLSFMRRLALTAGRGEPRDNVDWIRRMGMMMAYRKAVFEEFDETYAQAFGVQPVRPSRNDSGAPDQPDKFAPRATPLSGQLKIAETLSKKSSSSSSAAITRPAPKQVKAPSAKKNKYVLKRRDEPSDSIFPAIISPKPRLPDLYPFAAPQSSSGRSRANMGQQQQQQQGFQINYLPSFAANSDYMLQRRESVAGAPVVAKKDEHVEQMVSFEQPLLGSESKPGVPEISFAPVKPDLSVVVAGAADVFQREEKLHSDQKDGVGMNLSGSYDRPESKMEYSTSSDPAVPSLVDFLPQPGRIYQASSIGGKVVKKEKVVKRKREDGMAVKPTGIAGEVVMKKKKKKSKNLGTEAGPDQSSKKLKKIAKSGKSLGTGLRNKVDMGSAPVLEPELDLVSTGIGLPDALCDLSGLASDPYFGSERNARAVVLQVFLKFRSLVYQKSSVLPPPSEPEASEFQASKLAAGRTLKEPMSATAEMTPAKEAREQKEPSSSSKSLKSLKPDDPTRMGRKRNPSDRQEELSAKRLKKLNQVKALSAEKKSGLKTSDGQQRDQKVQKEAAAVTTAPVKTKFEPVKKQEAPPPKVVSPTYLVMKFPRSATLPSVANLKARFARFGPLDVDGTRVYWKSHTCKVLFKYRVDAVAAYSHVTSTDIFGQIKVNYNLRELEMPLLDPSEPMNNRGDDIRTGNVNGSSSSMIQSRPSLFSQQRQQQGQLKSILKKPGEDLGAAAKESQRVKFMLGGGDNERIEPSPVFSTSSNGNGRGEGAPSSLPPPLSPIDPFLRHTKPANFLPPPPPVLSAPPMLQAPLMHPSRAPDMRHLLPTTTPLPLPPMSRPLYPPQRSSFPPSITGAYESQQPPPQFAEAQIHGDPTARGRASVDISNKMLSLLLRCNDIVSNVKSSLGYVPYHPL